MIDNNQYELYELLAQRAKERDEKTGRQILKRKKGGEKS